MRFNERQMINVSQMEADFEDRLNYKVVSLGYNSSQNKGFKELWFKLKYNLLFYFKLNDLGQIDLSQPSGLLVLENSLIHYEEDSGVPFAFSITFNGDNDKKHLFSARSEVKVEKWISMLKKASYEQMRREVKLLEEAIRRKKRDSKKILEKACTVVLNRTPNHIAQVPNGSMKAEDEDMIKF